MATVTMHKRSSFHKGELHLVRGENLDVPAHLAAELVNDPEHFTVSFGEGEAEAALIEVEEAATAVDENGVPKDKMVRLQIIAGVILYMSLPDTETPDEAYTGTGKPDARYLSGLLGWTVSGVDRDEAMKRMEKGTIEPIDFIPTSSEPETPAETGEDDQGSDLMDSGQQEPKEPETPSQSAPKGKLTISSGKTKKKAVEGDASTEGAKAV